MSVVAVRVLVALGALLFAWDASAQIIDLDDRRTDSVRPQRAPITAGEMSPRAAAAKRLFDQQRWPEAARALHRVAAGTTGDDVGNRQIASYYQAVALYKLRLRGAAAASFTKIVRDHHHLKFRESLLWLAKLVTEEPVRRDQLCPVIVESFTLAEPTCSWWKPEPEPRSALLYHCGSVEHEAGRYTRAMEMLRKVDANSRHYAQAQLSIAAAHIEMDQPHLAEPYLARASAASGDDESLIRAVRRLRERLALPPLFCALG